MNKHKAMMLQIMRFGTVGLTAATIHFTIVVSLVQLAGMRPLIANVFAFLVSFQVSYWGHRKWTFSDTVELHRVAFSKLLLVQLINFVLNEFLFYVFLSLHIPYPIALLMVFAALPVFTFISNKWWVFKSY
jgi:putative flippase GtrA